MGNSVELRSANYSSWQEAQNDQDESTWAIRDRAHDIPALLWLGCFNEENLTIEEEDGSYGHLFCSRTDAVQRLVAASSRLQDIFPNNSGITACAEHLINHLRSIDSTNLYLFLRLFDWHEEAESWTREAINVLQGTQTSSAETIAQRFNIDLKEKSFFGSKWATFMSPEELLEKDSPKPDWDRTGALVGWDTDDS